MVKEGIDLYPHILISCRSLGGIHIKAIVISLILLSLLLQSGAAQNDNSTSSGPGIGDVYVKNYTADIYLNGTLKESYTYAVESSDKYRMLYRSWKMPLSDQRLDTPYVELLNISAPSETISYEKDWRGQVHILSGNNSVSEIEELAERNEAGCFNPKKFSSGIYRIDYIFGVHLPIECDDEYCHIDLKLTDEHLPYQNVTIAVHDPENLTVKLLPYPAWNITRQGDAWVMTGSSDMNEPLGVEMLLRSDALENMEGRSETLAENRPPSEESFSLAIPAENLNGNSTWDMLVLNFTINTTENLLKSEISALKGSDGTTLWQRSYPNAIAYAFPVKDLNGDGMNDVVIDVVLEGLNFIPYSEVTALNGNNGTEIWSSSSMLAATVAYPLGNNRTDLLVHLFGIDAMNNSFMTRISSIDCINGTELDARIFPGAIAVEYPAGNLTRDNVTDSIIEVCNIEVDPQNVSASKMAIDIVALNGANRRELWNRSFNDSMALAIPTGDVNGDALDDLVVYELRSEGNNSMVSNIAAGEVPLLQNQSLPKLDLNTTGNSFSTEISVLRGMDGKILWQRSYNNSLAMATTVPDLTGDGVRDFIIYKLDESGKEGAGKTEAVKGDDGRLLWNRPSMMFVSS